MDKKQRLEAMTAQACLEEAEERLKKAGLYILAMKISHHIETLQRIRLKESDKELCGEEEDA